MPTEQACPILVLHPVIADLFGPPPPGTTFIEAWHDPELIPAGGARDVRVLLAAGSENMDGALFDHLPDLGLIACIATGYDGIDMAEAQKRGIAVTNAHGRNAPEVADVAVSMLLSLLCGLPAAHDHVLSGGWRSQGRLPLRPSLRGKRIGIVGLGAIGQAVAERLAPFGMEISWWGPHPKPDQPLPRAESLLALARASDALILCNRPDAASRHMIDKELLAALGPAGLLVNVARGMIVDEDALHHALITGELGGAGLDVFDPEPPADGRWATVPNLVLAPHIAGATIESVAAQIMMARENIDCFLHGRPLLSPL